MSQVCKRLAAAGPAEPPSSADSEDDLEPEKMSPEDALLVAVTHELLTVAAHLEDSGRAAGGAQGGGAGAGPQAEAAERAAGHASAISDVEARWTGGPALGALFFASRHSLHRAHAPTPGIAHPRARRRRRRRSSPRCWSGPGAASGRSRPRRRTSSATTARG